MEITTKNLTFSALVRDGSRCFQAVVGGIGGAALAAGDGSMGSPPRDKPGEERGRRLLRETEASAASLPPKQPPRWNRLSGCPDCPGARLAPTAARRRKVGRHG
jgi:hypothetical protein